MASKVLLCSTLLSSALFVSFVAADDQRSWTDVLNKSQIVAELVKQDSDSVTRKKNDLADERTRLKNQPVYESEHPGYLLLVFGMDAPKPVWVVSDENCVYIDRNSNGDLTEANEKIDVSEIKKIDGPNAAFREWRHYLLGDIPKSKTHPAYKKLSIQQFRNVTDNYPTTTQAEKATKERIERYPHLSGNISVTMDDFQQNAGPGFALSQKDAAIVHFDGPLSLSFSDHGENRAIEIDPENNVLPYKFRLGTPGVGPNDPFAYTKSPTLPVLRAVLKDNKQNEREGTVDLIFCGADYCTTIEVPNGITTDTITVLITVAPFAGRDVKPMEAELKIIRPSDPDRK